MRLDQLTSGLTDHTVVGDVSTEITGISTNTQTLSRGEAYVALIRVRDGHDFVRQAVEAGASAIVVDRKVDVCVPQVVVPSTDNALSEVALTFYDRPADKLRICGVTGTNGKTTTTYLIYAVLAATGIPTGLLGTVENRIGSRCVGSANTTPEAHELQRLLREMVEAGCETVVMEASSHGLSLKRLNGIKFDVAVYTNLTRDHLDFHKTFAEYKAAKATLFENLDPTAHAIVNVDDDSVDRMIQNSPARIVGYGQDASADFRIVSFDTEFQGSRVTVESQTELITADLSITGDFHQYNVAAALAACKVMGVETGTMIRALRDVQVPGRFEGIDAGQPFGVFVDYAHTPDGLINALSAGRRLARNRLISVFGCGGDRDRGKRPEMGRASAILADFSVVTSDNPRTEDQDVIIGEILPGLGDAPYRVEADRGKAIEIALDEAQAGDLVVIAGKGHEDYQVIGRESIQFDDREVARALLEKLGYKSKDA
ncbi:MAG: UDP-N-acetylmuramoyl-L-alanyl-D-glutamate--2,6-diaminopimelate ligase [Candidatus Latescibacterota bacterium]|nr:UDP-N-acetylmuramoyl-L-alanyl-D-glutamate--2,6-diaminopimelate ligase [Candidatus Latescibacterota bacterium]